MLDMRGHSGCWSKVVHLLVLGLHKGPHLKPEFGAAVCQRKARVDCQINALSIAPAILFTNPVIKTLLGDDLGGVHLGPMPQEILVQLFLAIFLEDFTFFELVVLPKIQVLNSFDGCNGNRNTPERSDSGKLFARW